MQRTLLTALLAGAIAPAGLAQILPGHSVATVIPTGLPSEMYDIDHEAGTATLLTISATLASKNVNAVVMTTPVTGYVGTNVAPGEVYSILISGGTVTETLLNTTPTAGANVAQITEVNGRLYFTTQNSSGTVGILQSIPVGGGAVQADLDLATLNCVGLANAVTSIGTKVYVATFNSSPNATGTTPGELVEFDTVANTGRLVMTLPAGGFDPNGAPWNTGIVNMMSDPLQPNLLVLQGVYGDVLRIDPVAATVTSAVWTGTKNAGGNALASSSCNSFTFDLVGQDFIVGTRAGVIERWVGSQQARRTIAGVGSHATLTSNSITGISFMQYGGGSDTSYGPGCKGNDGFTPTDSAYGAPVAGNANYKLGVFSMNPGDPVLLLMDFQNAVIGSSPLPLDLTPFGAPGCQLLTGNAFVQLVLTTGTGAGYGTGVLPLPIPSFATGFVLYRQWVELQTTPTNTLGLVTSNARRMAIQ